MAEETRPQPFSGRGRAVSLALVLACAAALLGPTADPEALRAQGVARLLREDAERAGRGEDALFADLSRRLGDRLVGVALTMDGEPVEGGRIAAAVGAAMRAFEARAERESPGESALPRQAHLELDLRVEDGRLALSGSLFTDDRVVALAEPAPVALPDRASLLPPLLAIGAALVWRRTLPALFLGILAGSIAMAARNGAGGWAPLRGLADVFGVYLWHELTDTFRFEIIGFIVALLAMVGVMSRAGGMAGLVERSRRFARSARSAQAMTWLSGLIVFFDDYANCMLVGSTLRPVTDRLRVSREKLAFLVDSTAAPVAGLSLLSTWIAYQVSLFAPQLSAAGIDQPAYAVFVASLPYRAYSWLALFFALAVALSGRDFGPMRRAEQRARRTGALVRPGARPPLSDNLARMQPAPGMTAAASRAVVPLAVTLAATLLGILVDGGGGALLVEGTWRDPGRWRAVLLEGSGATPIFRGAVAGLLTAAFLAGSDALRGVLGAACAAGMLGWGLGGAAAGAVAAGVTAVLVAPVARSVGARTRRPHLPLGEVARASAASAPTLGFASVLLFEAWMIGAVCTDLGTADYLVALLAGALDPTLLPMLLFVAAGLVAFATGSSWSTMAILVPNAVPLAAALGSESELGAVLTTVLAIGAVLDGAIFGDHCSPISDTTVLSSVASGCDHLDHVRTQAPYALTVAAAALVAAYLPPLLGLGWGPGVGLLGGATLLLLALALVGRAVDPPDGPAARQAEELP